MAVCYEAMNRSIFGPVVFNPAAPDDGNMMLLEAIGTDRQKERWLKPIVSGEALGLRDDGAPSGRRIRSVDDQTRAEKRGARYVVTGRKWFITGAEERATSS